MSHLRLCRGKSSNLIFVRTESGAGFCAWDERRERWQEEDLEVCWDYYQWLLRLLFTNFHERRWAGEVWLHYVLRHSASSHQHRVFRPCKWLLFCLQPFAIGSIISVSTGKNCLLLLFEGKSFCCCCFFFFLFYFPVLDLLLELWSTNSGERRDEETSIFLVVKSSRGRWLSLFVFWSFVDNFPVARHERHKKKKLFYSLVCLQTV